jgi:hypothetical protein
MIIHDTVTCQPACRGGAGWRIQTILALCDRACLFLQSIYLQSIDLPCNKRRKLDCGYRLDIVVSNSIILELKCCEKIEPIYEAQLLTYLKLSGLHLGLILNFNVTMMRNGIKRIVHELSEE